MKNGTKVQQKDDICKKITENQYFFVKIYGKDSKNHSSGRASAQRKPM